MSELGAPGRAVAIDKWTASIDDLELERSFIEGRAASDLQQIGLASIFGFFVTLCFAILDYLVISDHRTLAIGIRLVWAFSTIAFWAQLRYFRVFQGRTSLAGWLGIVSATLFYLAINVVSPTPDVYLSGFIIILFVLQFFFPLNFPTTVSIGFVCTLIFSIAIPLTREIAFGELATIYSQYLVVFVGGNIVVYLLNLYRRREFLSSREISRQRDQHEMLLNQIFPRDVVARMQNGEDRIADNFSNVTVLFADIVGFTKRSRELSADKLVDDLNTLFGRCDVLAHEHDVEKIKTIGDEYFAVSGLADNDGQHVLQMAKFALALDRLSRELGDQTWPNLKFRIAIHTGPVIAGVIGKSKFSYDVWGDTVNFAARLVAQCEPGQILVSEASHSDLSDALVFGETRQVSLRDVGQRAAYPVISLK